MALPPYHLLRLTDSLCSLSPLRTSSSSFSSPIDLQHSLFLFSFLLLLLQLILLLLTLVSFLHCISLFTFTSLWSCSLLSVSSLQCSLLLLLILPLFPISVSSLPLTFTHFSSFSSHPLHLLLLHHFPLTVFHLVFPFYMHLFLSLLLLFLSHFPLFYSLSCSSPSFSFFLYSYSTSPLVSLPSFSLSPSSFLFSIHPSLYHLFLLFLFLLLFINLCSFILFSCLPYRFFFTFYSSSSPASPSPYLIPLLFLPSSLLLPLYLLFLFLACFSLLSPPALHPLLFITFSLSHTPPFHLLTSLPDLSYLLPSSSFSTASFSPTSTHPLLLYYQLLLYLFLLCLLITFFHSLPLFPSESP